MTCRWTMAGAMGACGRALGEHVGASSREPRRKPQGALILKREEQLIQVTREELVKGQAEGTVLGPRTLEREFLRDSDPPCQGPPAVRKGKDWRDSVGLMMRRSLETWAEPHGKGGNLSGHSASSPHAFTLGKPVILILFSSYRFKTNSSKYSIIKQLPLYNAYAFRGSGNQQAR